MSTALATARVALSHRGRGLGVRVQRLLLAEPNVDIVDPSAADTLVWLDDHEQDLDDETAATDAVCTVPLTGMLQQHPTMTHLVLVSSAMVYGAYANNPVPLTEDAALRPEVEFAYARRLGAIEQAADAWRREAPDRTVTTLRPAVSVAADGTSSLARALAAGMGQRVGESDPPAQFLHLDDLAAAIALAVVARLDGVYNVAPDGWIPGERVRALSGGVPRIKLPDRVQEVVTGLRWRFQRGPIPPGLRSYTRTPWLVANDRLRAEGWEPKVTNEQAYVEGTEAKWWTMISPKRRQELALGAMVLAFVCAAIAAALGVRRARRR
jgi:nucleoside-diphosphate-sugar epimerase